MYEPKLAHTYLQKLNKLAQVNLKVGKGLASAIEKGQETAEATKQAVGKSINIVMSRMRQTSHFIS